jgi:hypothetical protein
MKTMNIMLLLFAIIFSGFSIDSKSAKGGVTVPLKFDGVIIQNTSTQTDCTPLFPGNSHSSTGWLQVISAWRTTDYRTKYRIIKSCNTDLTNWTIPQL